MSATFQWNQTYGVATGTATDIGKDGNLFNFKDADDATPANYSANAITAGDNSYEVWLRAHFTGTFTSISNLQFWKSAGTFSTGESIDWDGETEVYVTPVKTESVIATTAIPTADPGTANVSIGGNLAGSLDAAGYSDYIVLQLQTTGATDSGDTEGFVSIVQYNET